MVVADVSNLGLASLDGGANTSNIDRDSTHYIQNNHTQNNQPGARVVADAYLLFTGDFRRSGSDLVISKDDRHIVIDDYFKGEKRAALTSYDGAVLSGEVVQALSGDVQYAQASQAASAAAVIGKVSKLTGVATAIRNGVAVQLNIGDEVRKGDVVQTASASSLGLVFIDGTVFGLSANARMVLNEMIYDPAGSSNSSLLSLVQGTIVFVAGETAKRGDMRVETPAATMGIRGTSVLTEIDFVVPGSGAVPPVRVQVLEEPGGVSGSFLLYSRSSPTTVIGQVSQVGLVTSVSGTGDVSTATASPVSRATQSLIDQTMQEYFPNYVPKSTPPNGSSTPPGTPGNGLPIDPINFLFDPPLGSPLRADLIPTLRPTDDFVLLVNSPPQVNVNNVVVALPATSGSTFNIADQVSIFDPDTSNAFHDIPIPFVPGTAQLVGVSGPAPPNGAGPAGLINVDAQTGAVSYDPADFVFLAQGATITFTIAFDSQSGPDTLHRTLTLTIIGVNEAPTITSASLAVDEGSSVVLTAADIGVSDPDSTSFTFTVLNVTHGQFEIFVNGAWTSTSAFTSADIAAGHVRFTHDGGEIAPTFSIRANDGFDTTSEFTGTINFSPVNDPPVALADSNWAKADPYATVDGNVILGANHAPDNTEGSPPSGKFADVADTDVDSATLTVNAVNGSGANVGVAIAGLYGTLKLNADGTYCYMVNSAAVKALDSGETVIDPFTYTVTDGTATSNTSTLTITVFGNNDAPVAVADTNWAQEDLHTTIDGNVILGANHAPDDTEGNPPYGTFKDVADTDADIETLTVNSVNGSGANVGAALCGRYGTLTLNADGTYTYVVDSAAVQCLDSGQTVTDEFTYTVTDGDATSCISTLTITVFGNNDAPVAAADTNWAQERLHTSIDGNVIKGADHSPDTTEGNPPYGTFKDVADTDADAETLTVNTVNGSSANVGIALCGSYGTLTLNVNGTYCYVVNDVAVQGLGNGETAADQFTYTVTDGTATSNISTLTITVFGNNDPPSVVNMQNWMPSDPDQQTAGRPGYPDGYSLFVGIPTDIDGDNVTVTATGSIPQGVFYFNGSCYVELTCGTLLYDPSTSLNLLDDLVYRPTGCVSDAVDTTLVLDVFDGTVHVTETVGIHEVVQNHIPVGSFGATSGSSPLTSGNMQTATQAISQDQADAINAGGALAIVVQTDFQKTPIGTPVPLYEQGIGTAAGEARETEVSVFLNVTQGATTTRFVIVADDPDGCPVQTWSFNSTTGLMEATVDAGQIFVADGAGNPTQLSLETWLTTHPMSEGDTWNTVFVDDTPGDFQARSYSVQIFPNEPADPGINVNGNDLLADQIYGTSGNDTLAGNGGDDIIDGRGGNDLIAGGGGADNFRFAASTGHAVISDFASGQDHLDLSSIVATNDLDEWIASHVTASGQDTLISIDDGLTITLQNVHPASLSGSDFIVNPNGSFN